MSFTQQKSKLFRQSIDFLNMHPAINMHSHEFMEELHWWTEDICRHGIANVEEVDPKDVTVWFFKSDPGYHKFFKYRIKDRDSLLSTSDELNSIEVPYYVIYGTSWKYHKTQFNAEYVLHKFNGDIRNVKRRKTQVSQRRFEWFRYVGGTLHGKQTKTFEDMIIALADDVKEKYGNFAHSSFNTKEENENHAIQKMPYRFSDHKIDKRGNEYCELIKNENWINVYPETTNLRWWDWYRKTDFYKINHNGE